MTNPTPNAITEAIRALEAALYAIQDAEKDTSWIASEGTVVDIKANIHRLREIEAQLEGLAEVSAKATPGEWEWDSGIEPPDGPERYADIYVDGGNLIIARFNDQISEGQANADLIARSVNLVRLLTGEGA